MPDTPHESGNRSEGTGQASDGPSQARLPPRGEARDTNSGGDEALMLAYAAGDAGAFDRAEVRTTDP